MTAPRIGASVDLGSTSVHLLVAEVHDGHDLVPIHDESAFLGLGAAVDERGFFGGPLRTILADTLAGYAATARSLGAGTVGLIATEPFRRAADAARARAEVERGTGVGLNVLSHEEEAFLTLIGVTGGRPITVETIVVDIGGGSSEFCDVPARGEANATGVRLGANRLTARHVTHDPPTRDEMAAMVAAAEAALAALPPARPRELVLVGGTASNLLKVASGVVSDRRLGRERLAEAVARLHAEPTTDLVERYLVKPARARILPAGAAIIQAILRRYDLDEATVSDAGIREGAVLVAAHAERDWRDRLAALAHGWPEGPGSSPTPPAGVVGTG